MKRFIIGLALAVSLLSPSAWAERAQYIPDIIVTDPGAVWTDSRKYSTFDAAVAAMNVTGGTLLVASDLILSADATISSNVVLKFTPGSVITIASGKTLTICGFVDAGRYQIFDDNSGAGTVTFTVTNGNSPNTVAYPEWWGAACDATTDDKAEIQSALDCGLPVVEFMAREALSTSHYLVSGTLTIPRSNMTLRGVSAGMTPLMPAIGSTDFDASILYASGKSYLSVENLHFGYAYSSYSDSVPITGPGTNEGGVIHFNAVSVANIKNCRISEGYNGIVLEDCATVFVDHVSFGWSEYSNFYVRADDAACTDIILQNFTINNYETNGASQNDEGGQGGAIRLESRLAYGAHDGLDNAAILTDSGESWTTNMFPTANANVYNLTDGSSAVISANSSNTVTGTLSGGTDDDWDIGDLYAIAYDRKIHTTIIRDGDVVLSKYSMAVVDEGLVFAASTEPNSYFGSAVAHSFINNVTFDTSYSDSLYINGMEDSIFSNCYFNTGDKSGTYAGTPADAGANAVHILNGHKLQFKDCTIPLAAYNGFFVENLTENLSISGCTITGVGKQTAGSGIFVEGDTNSFIISNNMIKEGYYYGADMDYGIQIGGGSSDNYSIIGNNVVEVDVAGIVDNGLGDNKVIRDNLLAASERTVASASELNIPADGRVIKVTGTTGVTKILTCGVLTNPPDGRVVTLLFADAVTITEGENLVMAGNFTSGAGDTITFVVFDEIWYEIARSDN